MKRWLALMGVTALLLSPAPAFPVAPGAAQQPLPTPRGQLGGREEIAPGELPGEPVPYPGSLPVPPPAGPVGEATGSEVAPTARTLAPSVESIVSVVAWTGDIEQAGSGWVWDETGLVVTAASLVALGERIDVTMPGGTPTTADVVAIDRRIGVAVLRAPGAGGRSVASTADVAPGEVVFATGWPPDAAEPVRIQASVAAPGESSTGASGWLRVSVGEDGDWPVWMTGAPVDTPEGVVGMAIAAASVSWNGRAAATPSPEDKRDLGSSAYGFVVPIDRVAAVVEAATGN